MIFDLVNDEPHWKVAMFMASQSENFKRLLNVAVTRAQRRLIIVGDFDYISKQGRKAFIHELLDFLLERYPVVEAGAADRRALGQGGADADPGERRRRGRSGPARRRDSFDQHLLPDLESAEQRLVIFSPFLTYDRVASLEPQLRAAVERGTRVVVVTKEQAERGRQLDGYRHRARSCELGRDDRAQGKNAREARLHRRRGALARLAEPTQLLRHPGNHGAPAQQSGRGDYQRTLRLEELLGAYEQREAGEGACPFCGERSSHRRARRPLLLALRRGQLLLTQHRRSDAERR